jgi:hypothetical protein
MIGNSSLTVTRARPNFLRLPAGFVLATIFPVLAVAQSYSASSPAFAVRIREAVVETLQSILR